MRKHSEKLDSNDPSAAQTAQTLGVDEALQMMNDMDEVIAEWELEAKRIEARQRAAETADAYQSGRSAILKEMVE